MQSDIYRQKVIISFEALVKLKMKERKNLNKLEATT